VGSNGIPLSFLVVYAEKLHARVIMKNVKTKGLIGSAYTLNEKFINKKEKQGCYF
jgi:hypothetical protein